MQKIVALIVKSPEFLIVENIFNTLVSHYTKLIKECINDDAVYKAREASLKDTPKRASKALLETHSDQVAEALGISVPGLIAALQLLKPVSSNTQFKITPTQREIVDAKLKLTVRNIQSGQHGVTVSIELNDGATILGLSKFSRLSDDVLRGEIPPDSPTDALSEKIAKTLNLTDSGSISVTIDVDKHIHSNGLAQAPRLSKDEITQLKDGKVIQREVTRISAMTVGYAVNEPIQPVYTDRLEGESPITYQCAISSMCEHHTYPFDGALTLRYSLPAGEGRQLSDDYLKAIIERRTNRFQTQEDLTYEIYHDLSVALTELGATHLRVEIKDSVHTCMSKRGVRQTLASTSTLVGG